MYEKKPMMCKKYPGKYRLLLIVIVACALAAGGCLYWVPCREKVLALYAFLIDRQRVAAYLGGFGPYAPLIFIVFQVLQVIAAPVPGEATGFMGGYLFGVVEGFICSSIGLGVGSWVYFMIGRFLGRRYVRRRIPLRKLQRMDALVRRQGTLVIFFLFVLPGFPKDYLCLFLGISALPAKVFILLATIGRMPGTLMLSFQGAALFNRQYGLFLLFGVICLALGGLAYRYRERLYAWVEKTNGK